MSAPPTTYRSRKRESELAPDLMEFFAALLGLGSKFAGGLLSIYFVQEQSAFLKSLPEVCELTMFSVLYRSFQ